MPALFSTQVGNQLAELSVLDEEGVDALISGLRDRLVGNEPTESLPDYVPKGAAIVQAALAPCSTAARTWGWGSAFG